MGILQECSKCKTRSSIRKKVCKCGLNMSKGSGKNYWIEYYFFGRRKRERIGKSKAAAQQRLRDVLKARTEERYIDKDPASRLTLGEVSKWYLTLPEVKAKDSYRRDTEFIRHLKRLLGESIKIKDLTLGKVESYQTTRLNEPSPRHPGENIRPATVNKEVTCLKTILNRAVRHGRLKHNPIDGAKKLPENNVRGRILTLEEFDSLLESCADHIKPLILMAYYMGMRKSEIVFLTWPEVDLRKGFIRLPAERTKTDEARNIPIHPVVKTVLQGLPKGLHTNRVFLLNGNPLDNIKKSFKGACQRAGITDFTFHDLRHCALNNLRRAGNDYFKIMAISGHKTTSCFKRYNLVTEEELGKVMWPTVGSKPRTMDTYMDTKEKKATSQSL